MTGKIQVTPRQGALATTRKPPPREFHELWFALATKDWRSAVLVPADAGGSAAAAATSLADVGRQLHDFPVTLFIMADQADYWPAVQIVNTAASAQAEAAAPEAPPEMLDYASAVQVVASAAAPPKGARGAAGKVIVAIQPVVVEPLGLAVTQAADIVILVVARGQTRLAAARRTIELVGRERVVGCFLDASSANLGTVRE